MSNRSRIQSNEYADIRMFSGVENWRRVPAALSADDARLNVGSRSTIVTRPSNAASSSRCTATAPPIAPPPMTTTSLGAVTRRSLEVEGDAAQAGLTVELGGPAPRAEPVEDPLGEGQVHPAHQVPMRLHERVKRTVAEAQPTVALQGLVASFGEALDQRRLP